MSSSELLQEISAVELCTTYLYRFLTINSVPELVKEAERAFEELLPMEYSGLYLFNEESGKLELLMAHGFNDDERKDAESTAMNRHPGYVFRTGEAIYIPDVGNDPFCITNDSKRSFIVNCRLYEPISNGRKVIGTFGVVSSKKNAFSENDRTLFRFLCTLTGQVYSRLSSEESRRQSELLNKKLSAIATQTSNAVVITDRTGRIEWVNRSFEKMTGYQLEEAQGKIPGRLLQGTSEISEIRTLMREAIRNGKEVNATLTNYTKQGNPYEVNLQISPLFSDSGELLNFISLQQDVTKEVNAVRALNRQKNQLKALLNALPDEMYIINSNGAVEEYYANDLADMHVHQPDIVGKQIMDQKQWTSFKELPGLIRDTLLGKPLKSFEYIMEGEENRRTFEIRFAKLDEARVVMIIRNITERILLQEERDEQIKATEEAIKIVSEQNLQLLNFSYIISHNIRSHSSNISGLIDLIVENKDKNLEGQFIQSLKKSSINLDETLRYLSDLLVIRSKQNIQEDEIHLKSLCNKIEGSLSLEVETTRTRIENNIDEHLVVHADRAYLESILMNLISNAIKYRRSNVNPRVILSSDCRNDSIIIQVKDNGLGIDLIANKDKIFGMFKTFHENKNARGIGLFITKNQVEALGGRIEVRSKPGQGTTFRIIFPSRKENRSNVTL